MAKILRVVISYGILVTLTLQLYLSSSQADEMSDDEDGEIYPDITNCFPGAVSAGRDNNYADLRRINTFCSATNGNQTSVCFKICVLDMWRLIGRDRVTLNEDIDRNPKNYDEVSSSRLLMVDYRAVTGPVWALVAVRMLGIPFPEIRDKFKMEKDLMTKRMNKCKEFRFQSFLKDNHCEGIPNPEMSDVPETNRQEEWEKLIACIENALVC